MSLSSDQASSTGGTNGFSVFNWVIDAHPEDIRKIDFKRPDGTPVMRTVADDRQLNDALFHAGLNSGSQFEWKDEANRLHFYVVDLQRNAQGILSYTLAVRSLDGAGPQTRGVALTGAASGQLAVGASATIDVSLRNAGKAASLPEGAYGTDVTAYTSTDVFRLSVTTEGEGWSAGVQNALAAVPFGGAQSIPLFLTRSAKSASAAAVTVMAVSESDQTKKATDVYRVR